VWHSPDDPEWQGKRPVVSIPAVGLVFFLSKNSPTRKHAPQPEWPTPSPRLSRGHMFEVPSADLTKWEKTCERKVFGESTAECKALFKKKFAASDARRGRRVRVGAVVDANGASNTEEQPAAAPPAPAAAIPGPCVAQGYPERPLTAHRPRDMLPRPPVGSVPYCDVWEERRQHTMWDWVSDAPAGGDLQDCKWPCGHYEPNGNDPLTYAEEWFFLARAFGSPQDETEWVCPERLAPADADGPPALVLHDGKTSFRLQDSVRFDAPLMKAKLLVCASLLTLAARLRCKEATEDEILVFHESSAMSSTTSHLHLLGEAWYPGHRRHRPSFRPGEQPTSSSLPAFSREGLGTGAQSYSEDLGRWTVDMSHAELRMSEYYKLSHRFPTTTDGWACGPYFFEGDDWKEVDFSKVAENHGEEGPYGLGRVQYGHGYSPFVQDAEGFRDTDFAVLGEVHFGERGPERWFAHADVVGNGWAAQDGWDTEGDGWETRGWSGSHAGYNTAGRPEDGGFDRGFITRDWEYGRGYDFPTCDHCDHACQARWGIAY